MAFVDREGARFHIVGVGCIEYGDDRRVVEPWCGALGRRGGGASAYESSGERDRSTRGRDGAL